MLVSIPGQPDGLLRMVAGMAAERRSARIELRPFLPFKALEEKKVSATNYLVRTKDRDKFAGALDKEWPGPVPYTLVVAPGGR